MTYKANINDIYGSLISLGGKAYSKQIQDYILTIYCNNLIPENYRNERTFRMTIQKLIEIHCPQASGYNKTKNLFIMNRTGRGLYSKDLSPYLKRIYKKPTITERQGLITSRVGQGWYRDSIIERWKGKCAVIGCSLKNILIASHIVPWKDCNDDERLDIDNGILLSPVLDALFDKHLVTFSDAGRIIMSEIFLEELLILGIDANAKIIGLTEGNKRYLKRHRISFNKTKTVS